MAMPVCSMEGCVSFFSRGHEPNLIFLVQNNVTNVTYLTCMSLNSVRNEIYEFVCIY